MIGEILCSTGAFSRDPDLTSPEIIFIGLAEIECDGFELIFYPAFYEEPESVRATLTPAKDKLQVLHCEKSIGPLLGTGDPQDATTALDRFQVNAELAAALGIKRLVLHLWGLPESDRFIERNLSYFEQCNEIAEFYGRQLTIESIPCLESTPLRHFRTLMASSDRAIFTLDTEFLAMHGELNIALADEALLARTRQIHLKDFGGSLVDEHGKRVYLHPGQGKVDFRDVLSKIHRTPNIVDICLESTSVDSTGDVHYEQVRQDLAFITAIIQDVRNLERRP